MANLYSDIAQRTGGDIYIGVVGPVRTGKSTLIQRFMGELVLPNITGDYDRERARDEMPQSAGGKTVMTTEPKFIPDDAVEIRVGEGGTLRVKMIDCVGYIVPDAMGHVEEGQPRMVQTPWSEAPMPFAEAAELGTKKVIREHSTIGIVVTTDGSIGEIPRGSYTEAEERVVRELKQLGKPFALVLNSARPEAEEAVQLAYRLEEKYGVPVALVNCLTLDAEDIRQILELVLREFPVCGVRVELPAWVCAVEQSHPVRCAVTAAIRQCAERVHKVGEISRAFAAMTDCPYVTDCRLQTLDLGRGNAVMEVQLDEALYYSMLSELTGMEIADEGALIETVRDLAAVKKQYDKIAEALQAAEEKGYGIVMPNVEDLKLDEPEIVKQAGGYGVRLRASAQSVHMIRANIEAEISPIVGTEQQSEDLVRNILREFEADPQQLWESNMFGKSLYELMNEGLHAKLEHMPEDARAKLAETLERIINEGSGGLICILL